MSNTEINGDVAQLVQGNAYDVHVYGSSQRPHPPPEQSIECAQCGQATWRRTQHCMHCAYDLWQHNLIATQQQALWRLQKIAGSFVTVGCSVIASVAFLEGMWSWLPGGHMTAGALGMACLFIAGSAVTEADKLRKRF